MTSISLFRSDSGEVFFDRPVKSLVENLYKAADEVLDAPISYHLPSGVTVCKRVGRVLVEQVEDASDYLVQAVEKPRVNRKPEGKPGTSVFQSLIFDKKVFATPQAARDWLGARDGVGDYGMDETETTYRFRQYDPEHFTRFRTMPVTTGVTAVLGIIKGGNEGVPDGTGPGSEQAQSKSEHVPADVKALNASIREHGLLVMPGSASVRKAKADDEEMGEDEPEEDTEERYVLSLVMEPNDGEDGAPYKPDTQGDIQSVGEIRKAAHRWMEHYGLVDLMHSWKSLTKDDVRVLESYLAPCDFELGEDGKRYKILKGSWLLGIRVLNEEIWDAIKAGELGAYSIGGTAIRKPIDEEASDGGEEKA